MTIVWENTLFSLAKTAQSLIWKDSQDYAPQLLPCKAFKGFVYKKDNVL
jgi:hypothetical protein